MSASHNQQNNAINWNFRQASSKHLITLEPKAYLFFSKSLSFSGLCKILPLLGGSKRGTLKASLKSVKSVKFGGNVAFLLRFGPFFYNERKAGQDKMFILTLMLYCTCKSCKIRITVVPPQVRLEPSPRFVFAPTLSRSALTQSHFALTKS